MALICVGSTDLLSAEHTSRLLGPLLHWFYPRISPLTVLRLQILIRKAGHVTEYAILALLMFRALANTLFWRSAIGAMALTLIAAGAFAATDEFHQSFVPSRTASLRDVSIDTLGAGVGIAIYAVWWRRYRQRALPRSFSTNSGPERI